MKLHTIKGEFFNQVGSEVSFREDSGKMVVVQNLAIPEYITQNKRLTGVTGKNGVFLIAEYSATNRVMYGAKFGDEDAIFLEPDHSKIEGRLIVYALSSLLGIVFALFFLPFLLIVLIVGIPFFIACMWALFKGRRQTRMLGEHAVAAGFRKIGRAQFEKEVRVI